MMAIQLLLLAATAVAFSPLAGALPASSLARSACISMDETMMQNAWDGTLEEEGAEDSAPASRAPQLSAFTRRRFAHSNLGHSLAVGGRVGRFQYIAARPEP